MNNDYRGDQSKLKGYASSSTARWFLQREGGYSADIYHGGDWNVYACWPIEGYFSKEQAQLKQLR